MRSSLSLTMFVYDSCATVEKKNFISEGNAAGGLQENTRRVFQLMQDT
jgi:hypothetical protein